MAPRRDEEEDFVDLRAPEHAWWAGRPTDPFAPVEPQPPDEPEAIEVPEPEVLEPDVVEPEMVEPEPEPEPRQPEVLDGEIPQDLHPDAVAVDETDPYAVLRLPPTATWEEIIAAYRRLARWWHPDGLGAAAEWGRDACEHKIRQLNAAYSELRIRRGR